MGLPVSDVNREKAPPPAAIIPPAKSKLFVDSTDDESDNEEPDIFADLKVAKPKIDDQDKKKSSKGLFSFSDDSGSEDDIFADIGGKHVNNSKTEEEQPSDSSPNDLFTDVGLSSPEVKDKGENVTSQSRKAPVGGVSMFGKGFNLGSLLKKKEKSGSNDEAEDTTDAKVDTTTDQDDKEVEQSKARKLESVDSLVLPINIGDMPSVEAKSLFTDIAEDKETGAQPISAAEIICSEDEDVEPKRETVKALIGGISLFGSFNPSDALSKKSNEKEENGLFGEINSAPEDFSDFPSVATSPSNVEDKSVDGDGPLFTEPPPMDSKPAKDIVAKDIFGDSDSDDDLFGDLISKTGQKPNVPFSVKNSMFGFDEEDDDEDDIFSDIMKKK